MIYCIFQPILVQSETNIVLNQWSQYLLRGSHDKELRVQYFYSMNGSIQWVTHISPVVFLTGRKNNYTDLKLNNPSILCLLPSPFI